MAEAERETIIAQVAAKSMRPNLSRSITLRASRAGHVHLSIGGYQPPSELARRKATPIESRDAPAHWSDLFDSTKRDPVQEKTILPRLIVGTSHPVLSQTKNSIGMEFVRLPAGEFMMGCPTTEPGCNATERQHPVELTRDFWIGTTEVTQKQWCQVMENQPDGTKGDELPMHSITWSEAKAFCERLSALEGKRYRLPTEAEWEYACRAGTTTAYSFGDSAARLGQYGWYNGNARGRPQPVGGKRPNPWGLHDMHGNVAEWCEDWFAWRYPVDKQIDPVRSVESGTGPVVRGGRCDFYAPSCRSAARDNRGPNDRSASVGFRVVLEIDDSE